MSGNYKNVSSNMPDPVADFQPDQSTTPEDWSASSDRAVVVGLYGIPGSGKTTLLNQLKQNLGQTQFAFYEGSEMIASVVPGGLDAFQRTKEEEKAHWRQCAVDVIGKHSAKSRQVAVVAGHFMFWLEKQECGLPVYTQNDLDTFTHILYLDVPAEIIAQHRLEDVNRSRPAVSITHLKKW